MPGPPGPARARARAPNVEPSSAAPERSAAGLTATAATTISPSGTSVRDPCPVTAWVVPFDAMLAEAVARALDRPGRRWPLPAWTVEAGVSAGYAGYIPRPALLREAETLDQSSLSDLPCLQRCLRFSRFRVRAHGARDISRVRARRHPTGATVNAPA